MFVQAFVAFLMGSLVVNTLRWQANKLIDRHLRKQLSKLPPMVPPMAFPSLLTLDPIKWCTCSCGERHPRFCGHE